MTPASPSIIPLTLEEQAREAWAALTTEERRGLSRAITDEILAVLAAVVADAAEKGAAFRGEAKSCARGMWSPGA